MSRLWRFAGALVVGGLVAAACSSTPNKPNATTTTTSQSTTSTTSTSSTSSTASPSTTTSTAAASACGSVSATGGSTQGAAGTITGSIVLSETGSASCTLTGYPTLALFSSSGASLPVTVVDGLSVNLSPAANGPPAPVNLSPSSKVDFSYEFSDVPSGSQTSCPTSSTAAVSLPSGLGSTPRFTLTMDPCDNGTVRVSPLYAHS